MKGDKRMDRQMRRKKQELSIIECEEILQQGTSGVLALAGNDQLPYAVPISYVYDGQNLYFHCAKSGHKLDIIRENSNVSFCVIAQDDIVPEKYTTLYRSVIVFGKMEIITDDEEKRLTIEKLAIKYHPLDTMEGREKEIEKDWDYFYMLKMIPEKISGKKSIELVNK